MRRTLSLSGIAILLFVIFPFTSFSQIYSPEGLNMPGEWNAWTNPPANNLAFASSTQVTDGRVTLIETGTLRWQTTIHVAATGGDIEEGTYTWLFTSGPETDAFANKWAGVTVTMNTLQEYTFQGTDDNSITVTNDHWYTMNWEDIGYANSNAIFMETTAEPVDLLTVSTPATANPDEIINIDITTSAPPCVEEVFYLRYTTDSWATSATADIAITGTTGTASIPGQAAGTVVEYYAFSSVVTGISGDYDMQTINLNNNSNTNYSYTVSGGPEPEIDWANLQYPGSGTIITGDSYNVYSQVLIDGITNPSGQAPDVQAWIGYSTDNTDPSTWTNWITSTYSSDVGNNDEYIANLGLAITTEGTYYYASRFQYLDQDFVYGGYSETGGGFWDGTTNVNGILTVNDTPPVPAIDWANLQYPEAGTIETGMDYLVYGQLWIADSTGQSVPLDGLEAWVGYSLNDNDPATWTNWIAADFNASSGNNDEYVANLGTEIVAEGTYYYATRFQYLGQDYVYGGYSETGGGFWDGTDNVSGVLTVSDLPPVQDIGWANLQYPDSGIIENGQEYLVYAQAWIEDSTGLTPPVSGLQSWIGYSTTNDDPATWTNWVQADYNAPSGNNDEFVADLGAVIMEEGTYYYASRFQYLDEAFVYGGYSETGGGFWDGTENVSGVLTVEGAAITYPVTFTAIDDTHLYSNIKFKGSMTGWEAVNMNQDGNIWTVTLDVRPGSYEWGVFEDDGSQYGIWLVIGPNLEVTISDEGVITGDTTYTITYTDINEVSDDMVAYPNPAKDVIKITTSNTISTTARLYSSTGVLVAEATLTRGSAEISVSGLPTGMYILKTDNVITKIIKQ